MTFRQYLRYSRNPKELVDIMMAIIEGILQIHCMGYAHRDLKPENIVLNLDPLEVKIIDFDRARLFTTSSKGTALGTPGYFPVVYEWPDGSKAWDTWAFVAILCEADMKHDEYFGTQTEADCKQRMRNHLARKKTSQILRDIVEHVVLI